MKVIKKRIIVFILCFTLFSCGFVHTDPVKEVKASATVAALSFVILGLTAIGFNYYSQASASSLQNDIEIYASEHNTTSASFLNAFQSVVVDVAKDAVKFTAAQVYLLKEFANSLINKDKVSYTPITSSSFEMVPLFGYPCLVRVSAGDRLTFKFANNSNFGYIDVLNSTGKCYIGYTCYSANFDNPTLSRIFLAYLGGNESCSLKITYPDGSSVNKSLGSGNSYIDSFFGNASHLGNSSFNYITLNGQIFTNAYFENTFTNYPTIYLYDKYLEALRLRFGYNPNTSTFTGDLTLPTYSVNMQIFGNIASDKDLVITSPDVIDKAVDNAIVRNPSATSVTVDDVAAAIDGTAVGVIDPAAEDEEDRVIAPPISLDDDLAISQDTAITDTVVEDLDIGDPVPPPDPPPVIPEIDSALAAKFPFSIFSDFILIMSIFDEDPEAPVFNLGFTALGRDFQFTIDLSAFDSVASVVRTMELLAFIVGIIFVTIKFMQGGSD